MTNRHSIFEVGHERLFLCADALGPSRMHHSPTSNAGMGRRPPDATRQSRTGLVRGKAPRHGAPTLPTKASSLFHEVPRLQGHQQIRARRVLGEQDDKRRGSLETTGDTLRRWSHPVRPHPRPLFLLRLRSRLPPDRRRYAFTGCRRHCGLLRSRRSGGWLKTGHHSLNGTRQASKGKTPSGPVGNRPTTPEPLSKGHP